MQYARGDLEDSDYFLSKDEAEAIARLSTLESLREQARSGRRGVVLANIEKLIEAELRTLQRLRGRGQSSESAT